MCIVSVCGSMKQWTVCCWREPQSKPIEMLLLFGYSRSLIDQIPDIWSIRGSSSIKTKAYLVLVDAVAKIFLLCRPTQRIMMCNEPQIQLAWYLVDALAMLLAGPTFYLHIRDLLANVLYSKLRWPCSYTL